MNEEFVHAVVLARQKLRPAEAVSTKPLSALAAAAFFALSAITFATTAVLAPANEKMPAARAGVR